MIAVGVELDVEELWQTVAAERRSLVGLLKTLTSAEWDLPTLCADWRVRDVVAHLALEPQVGWGWALREFARARGNKDRMIRDSAVRLGARPVEEILADLRSIVDSRWTAPTITHREPLIDILVHGQDIALALGRDRPMPPAAARDSADRVWTLPWRLRMWPRPNGYRLVATDIEWTRGEGEEISGPISALLLLLTGRTKAAAPRLNGAVPVGD